MRPPKIRDIRKLLHFIYRYHFTLCIPFLRIIKFIGCINTIKKKIQQYTNKNKNIALSQVSLVCLQIYKRILLSAIYFVADVLVIGAHWRVWVAESGPLHSGVSRFPTS